MLYMVVFKITTFPEVSKPPKMTILLHQDVTNLALSYVPGDDVDWLHLKDAKKKFIVLLEII